MSNTEGLKETGSMFEYMITHYRWFFVVFFLFPLSLVYDLYQGICNLFARCFYPNKPHEHGMRVDKIRMEIQDWISEGCKTKLCTARPGWAAMSLRAGRYKSSYRNININLYDVLEINEAKQSCRVEPMCSMGKLTAALLPKGWTIPVIPELDDLTVGGLVAGVGIETSSHKYGLFQHCCLGFEVVLADGSLVNCSATENTDLFYSIPWSHGTLGFVVSVELQMIRARNYVDLTYLPYHNKADAIEEFAYQSKEAKYDFVECLAYSESEYVVMLGNLTDTKHIEGAVFNPIGRWYSEWFYKHVEKFLRREERAGLSSQGKHYSKTDKSEPKYQPVSTSSSPLVHKVDREIIPLRHYYHRHSRSLFWEMQDIVPFGNNIVFRYMLGWMMPPAPALLKRTQTEQLRKLYELHHMVQDMLVPMSKLSSCLDVFHHEAAIYPLWLCPFKIPSNAQRPDTGFGTLPSNSTTSAVTSASPHNTRGRKTPISEVTKDRGFIHGASAGQGEELFVDVGAYGNPVVPHYEARTSHRKIEEYVRSVQGYQMMYADSYMTKEEFREMFDHSLYDRMRAALPLCTQAFPEVYDKVSKAARI